MTKKFNNKIAKKSLINKEKEFKETLEQERLETLEQITNILKKEFNKKNIEVFLVGSITRPYSFNRNSDIDIVLKNFNGDRFDIWTAIDRQIDRNVEIILYEKCHFQEHIDQEGIRIL